MKNTAILLATFAFVGCGLKDIRPTTETPDDAAASRGRALLTAMADAHGGADRFKTSGAFRAAFNDDWSIVTFPFSLLKPYDVPQQEFDLVQIAGHDDGRQDFKNGSRAGTSFGTTGGKEFTVKDGAATFAENDRGAFSLATTGYLLQAPFRLGEADVVYFAGQGLVDGKRYEKVFLSWGQAAPQDTVDQFVAWIDADTMRLAFLEFTARGARKNISLVCAFEDYREIDGLQFAKRIRVVDAPGGASKLHIMNILDVDLGVDLPEGYLSGSAAVLKGVHEQHARVGSGS